MERFWHRQISRTGNWREANFEWPGLGRWILVALTLPIFAFQLSESTRFWLLQMFDSFNPARWYVLKTVPWLLALCFGIALFLVHRPGARMIVFAAVGVYAALFVGRTFMGSFAWDGTFDVIGMDPGPWKIPLYEGIILGVIASLAYNALRGARATPWKFKNLAFLVSVYGSWPSHHFTSPE